MIGDIYKHTQVSAYQPSDDVKEITSFCKKDYGYGYEILHRPWIELNGRSVIEDMNRGQRTFNAFVDESIEDPAEAWKWRGTRSKARNKAIALHAQITTGYIVPNYVAQNENQEEDRDFSDFMHDGVEWMIQNSEYKSSFLLATMGMLQNPVTYLGAEYVEAFQKIKQKIDSGYIERDIIDEELSGFRAPVYSADQILISNAYDQNIQRHRFNIKRRFIEYSEAKALFGHHENFPFVSPGIKAIYSEEDGLFYDVKDDDHPHLVELATVSYRRDDAEIPFINGIYMGNMENVQMNPMRHRDNRGAPKYNITPMGYHRVNEHFYFYKSLMNIQYWDNSLIDAQYELAMNRAFLDTNMPIAISGTDKVDSEIIFPSSVVAFEDKDTRVQPLLPQANLGNMFSAMSVVENSLEESSISGVTAGQLPGGDQKATAIAVAERNARILLQGVGKTLAESISQYGGLMADIFINNYSTAQADEMTGGNTKLKYRKLILKNKIVNGKEVSKVLLFDESLLGKNMSEKEKRMRNLKLLEKVGYPNNKQHIYAVNPELFSRRKYLCYIVPERMFPENEEFTKAIMSQLYAQFRSDPLIEPETLLRKVLYAYFRGESDELIKKTQQVIPGMTGMQEAETPPQTTFGQQAQNTATAVGNRIAGLQ